MGWRDAETLYCDACGREFPRDAPHERRRANTHHRRKKWGSKYAHYCDDSCSEAGDASEVAESMGGYLGREGAFKVKLRWDVYNGPDLVLHENEDRTIFTTRHGWIRTIATTVVDAPDGRVEAMATKVSQPVLDSVRPYDD